METTRKKLSLNSLFKAHVWEQQG